MLGKTEISLLELLLDDCESNRDSVHAKRFRADHFDAINVIDQLVRSQCIIESNGKYRVGLLALSQLESALALGLMEKAEFLWGAYRQQYKEHLDNLIPLSSAAKQAGVELDTAKRTLVYMLDIPWTAGYTQLYDAVGASETVLKYERLNDFVLEVQSWTAPHNRQVAPTDLLGSTRESESATAPLPAWIAQLPEQVRLLLQEVHIAKRKNLPTLTAMGIRGVIDVVCWNTLQKDLGSFPAKLKKMLDDGHLSPAQHTALTAVVEAGNAASHRGFSPDPESLQTMLQALNHMIESIYVLQESARKLSSKTPARTRSSESK